MGADELQVRGVTLRRKPCVYTGSSGLDTRNDCRLSRPARPMSTETGIRYTISAASQKEKHTETNEGTIIAFITP